jgi:hypothetical protein
MVSTTSILALPHATTAERDSNYTSVPDGSYFFNTTIGEMQLTKDGGSTWNEVSTDPSPTTTKGDLIVSDGTSDQRLPVAGANGQILASDSTQPLGIRWFDASMNTAEMYFANNFSNTTFLNPNEPVKIVADVYSSDNLLGFTHLDGVLTKTSSGTQKYSVNCSVTARSGALTNKYNFYVAKDSVVLPKTEHATYLDSTDSRVRNADVQCITSLAQNQTLAIYVENTNTNQFCFVENLMCTVIQIYG